MFWAIIVFIDILISCMWLVLGAEAVFIYCISEKSKKDRFILIWGIVMLITAICHSLIYKGVLL